MRKILMWMFLCLMPVVSMQAQEDVTKFLGIPVDGTEEEMIQKLKAKGFWMDEDVGMLRGEFNGVDVYVTIATNKGKVRRVGLLMSALGMKREFGVDSILCASSSWIMKNTFRPRFQTMLFRKTKIYSMK